MSTLVQLLRQVGPGSARVGFAPNAPPMPSRAMLLLAHLPRREAALAEAALAAGADALLMDLDEAGAQALGEILAISGDKPCGARLAGYWRPEEVGALEGAGVDFVSFDPATAPPALLRPEKLGKVARVEQEWGDSWLRALNGLPIDAVEGPPLVPPGRSLCIADLIFCRRLASLVSKPMLVPVQSRLEAAELEALVELGIEALLLTGPVLGTSPQATAEATGFFRAAIDALPAHKLRRRPPRAVALLPPLPSAGLEHPQEVEEDTFP